MHQCRRHTGYAGCQGTVHGQAGNHVTVCIEIHITCCGQRRPLPAIDHDLETVAGAMQQPEPATTQPGTVGLDHGQHRAHCHGSIKGIATTGQDFHARLRCQRMRTGNRGNRRASRQQRGGHEQADTQQKGSVSEPFIDHRRWMFHPALLPVSFSYLAISCSRVSTRSGLIGMHSTGHTSTHCEVSK